MIAGPHVRPVPRGRVLVGALLLLGFLAGVVGLAEFLRHPPTVDPAAEPVEPDDPRVEIKCPDPQEETSRGRPVVVISSDLYDCPHSYDRAWVRYEGEAVGAILPRSDGAWAQLNDDAYAGDVGPLPAHREFRGGNAGVGVYLPEGLTEQVTAVGDHDTRGDVLTVTGVYYLSDPHSGEVGVIRAAAGEIVRTGEPIVHPPLPDRRIAAGVLALAALALVGSTRWWTRRR